MPVFSWQIQAGQLLTVFAVLASAAGSIYGAGAYVQSLRDDLAVATAARVQSDDNLTVVIRNLINEQLVAAANRASEQQALLAATRDSADATAKVAKGAALATNRLATATERLTDQTAAVRQAVDKAAIPQPRKGFFER